jgi:hypothetical protein
MSFGIRALHPAPRRPVVVVEGAADRVVVVDRDRAVDVSLRRRPHAVDVVLERELGSVDADDDQAVVAVGPRPRGRRAPGAAS